MNSLETERELQLGARLPYKCLGNVHSQLGRMFLLLYCSTFYCKQHELDVSSSLSLDEIKTCFSRFLFHLNLEKWDKYSGTILCQFCVKTYLSINISVQSILHGVDAYSFPGAFMQ